LFFFGLILAIICEIHENGLKSAHLYVIRYEKSKGLANIHDFAAHCGMANEQMAQG
jgi:hypothetical protein